MPNIRTFNAGDLSLRPTDRGMDAAEQSGRRIGNMYEDVGSAKRQAGNTLASSLGEGIKAIGDVGVQYMDHQEISRGMPAAANLLLEMQTKANEITKNADPNDPSVYAKFRDEVLEPTLEKFQESFNTENSQKWALGQVDNIRGHMQQKMSADISSMASNAVKLNLNQTANIASNTVAQDPTSLPTVLDLLAHSTRATVAASPNISASDAARVNGEVLQTLNEHVVKAAIQGAILKNPDAGLKMAQDPQYAKYVDGGEVNNFYKQVVRANKADATNARLEEERQRREVSEQNRDAIVSKAYEGGPDAPTMRDVLSIPQSQIRAEDREHLLQVIEKREVDVPEAVAKKNMVDMVGEISSGKIATMDPIYKALGDGKIDYTRFKELKTEFLAATSDDGSVLWRSRADFLKSYEPIVNPNDMIRGRTEDGYRRAYQLQQYAKIRENELRAAGKDPSVLYDPRSSDFLGNTPYAKPQSSASMLQNLKSGTTPSPAAPDAATPPPKDYPDARKAKDGKWYIEKDGKFFRVE